MKRLFLFVFVSLLALGVGIVVSCGGDDDDNDSADDDASDDDATNELDISICNPENVAFVTEIDNPFYPLAVGAQWVLEGEDDGEAVRVQITVLDENEEVMGVNTQVIEEREWADDVLTEVSRNFFAQTEEGTVCYFGEDVDIYDDAGEEVVDHEGAWRAGDNEALPGIVMPAEPAVGQSYDQEYAPDVALDHAEHESMGDTVEVPFGTFTDTLTVIETSPFDSGESLKQYARGVGILVDESIQLTAH